MTVDASTPGPAPRSGTSRPGAPRPAPPAVLPPPYLPPRALRRAARPRRVRSTLLAIVCGALALVPLGQHGAVDPEGVPARLAAVQFLLMVPVCVLVAKRLSMPFLLTGAAAGIALALPATPFPALIGLGVLVRTRRGPRVWLFAGLTVVATAVTVVWDIAAAPGGTSFASVFLDRPDRYAPAPWGAAPWLVPLATALLVAPFLVTALVGRLKAERDVAVTDTRRARSSVGALSEEVSRDRERRELARELHDTLASHLSSLSLNANALELGSAGREPELAEAARAVRESAQRSLEDVRQVIDVLRDPSAPSLADARRSGLSGLEELLADAQRAGDRVLARVFVTDPAGCAPAVAHAAYRIVQEALSNARRHAPGQDVAVALHGEPAAGISIAVENPLPTGAMRGQGEARGQGLGILGMRERAEQIGGTLAADRTLEGRFVVSAWLPWSVPEAPSPGDPSSGTPGVGDRVPLDRVPGDRMAGDPPAR